jgi:hypothetical protein
MTGSRVVATITATALSPFHDLDVIVMTLIWKLGTTPFWSGSAFFSWVAPPASQNSLRWRARRIALFPSIGEADPAPQSTISTS